MKSTLNAGATQSALNVTPAPSENSVLVYSGPATLYKILVWADAGSGNQPPSIGIYDTTTAPVAVYEPDLMGRFFPMGITGTGSSSTPAVSVYEVDWPMQSGIYVLLDSGAHVSLSYAPE